MRVVIWRNGFWARSHRPPYRQHEIRLLDFVQEQGLRRIGATNGETDHEQDLVRRSAEILSAPDRGARTGRGRHDTAPPDEKRRRGGRRRGLRRDDHPRPCGDPDAVYVLGGLQRSAHHRSVQQGERHRHRVRPDRGFARRIRQAAGGRQPRGRSRLDRHAVGDAHGPGRPGAGAQPRRLRRRLCHLLRPVQAAVRAAADRRQDHRRRHPLGLGRRLHQHRRYQARTSGKPTIRCSMPRTRTRSASWTGATGRSCRWRCMPASIRTRSWTRRR